MDILHKVQPPRRRRDKKKVAETTTIKICMGFACLQNFAQENCAVAEKILGIKAGETSADGKFRLEKTSCLSHCEEAPNVFFARQNGPLSMVITDGKVEKNVLPHHLEKKLKNLKDAS